MDMEASKRLIKCVISGNWKEIYRHLSNAYSSMLKDDIYQSMILSDSQFASLDAENLNDKERMDLLFLDYAPLMSIESFKKLIEVVGKQYPDLSDKMEQTFDELLPRYQNLNENRAQSPLELYNPSSLSTAQSLKSQPTHQSSFPMGIPELPLSYQPNSYRLTGNECEEDVQRFLSTNRGLACLNEEPMLVDQTTHSNSLNTDSSPRVKEQKHAEVYDMSGTPRGVAFIINNVKFDYFKTREGSNEDKEMLRNMFKSLGWDVTWKDDLTAAEMFRYIKRLSTHKALSSTSAIAVAILSHGMDNDIFFGTDGNFSEDKRAKQGTYVTRFELMQTLSGSNCTLMAGKPKMFIIQACRGSAEDIRDYKKGNGQTRNNAMKTDIASDHPSNIACGATQNVMNNMKEIPDHGDMCCIFSSSLGYKAYRMKNNGSPFIKHFTSTVMELAATTEFPSIMKEVRYKLYHEKLPEGKITLPDFSNQLIKDWYL